MLTCIPYLHHKDKFVYAPFGPMRQLVIWCCKSCYSDKSGTEWEKIGQQMMN